jgi:hypothetical protein
MGLIILKSLQIIDALKTSQILKYFQTLEK